MQIPSLLIGALFATVVLGQTPEAPPVSRVFSFTQAETGQDLAEIATVVRSITDIEDVSAEAGSRTLEVRGTADQVELAAWLVAELDKPPGDEDTVSSHYEISDDGADRAAVFHVINAATVQQLQELATAVRFVAQARRMFTCNRPRALAVRGTAEQLAMSEWLIGELDRPSDRESVTHQGGADDVASVFYLNRAASFRDLQEVAIALRAITDIRYAFAVPAPGAIVMRDNARRIAMARWLFEELNRPANWQPEATPDQNAGAREYRPADGDEVLRMLYLPDTTPVEDLEAAFSQIRSASQVYRMFLVSRPRALAMRGPAERVGLAEQLFKERLDPDPTDSRH